MWVRPNPHLILVTLPSTLPNPYLVTLPSTLPNPYLALVTLPSTLPNPHLVLVIFSIRYWGLVPLTVLASFTVLLAILWLEDLLNHDFNKFLLIQVSHFRLCFFSFFLRSL